MRWCTCSEDWCIKHTANIIQKLLSRLFLCFDICKQVFSCYGDRFYGPFLLPLNERNHFSVRGVGFRVLSGSGFCRPYYLASPWKKISCLSSVYSVLVWWAKGCIKYCSRPRRSTQGLKKYVLRTRASQGWHRRNYLPLIKTIC